MEGAARPGRKSLIAAALNTRLHHLEQINLVGNGLEVSFGAGRIPRRSLRTKGAQVGASGDERGGHGKNSRFQTGRKQKEPTVGFRTTREVHSLGKTDRHRSPERHSGAVTRVTQSRLLTIGRSFSVDATRSAMALASVAEVKGPS